MREWACPQCGEIAWGCAEQYDHWKTIHRCKETEVAQTIQERIEAARERAAKALAQAEALEKKAAEGPKRRVNRSVTEINEIRLLEEQMRKRYGVGYSGLAELVRKANKEGVPMPKPTGMAQPEPEGPGMTVAGEGADAVEETPDLPPTEQVIAPEDDTPPW